MRSGLGIRSPNSRASLYIIYVIVLCESSLGWMQTSLCPLRSSVIVPARLGVLDPYEIETIAIQDPQGMFTLAFSIPEKLRKWGGKIRGKSYL